MSVDRFQLITTTALALAVGSLGTMVLGSRDAVGFPSGPNVSYGANPVVATGGILNEGSSATVFTAPADHDIIITDVVVTPYAVADTCNALMQFALDFGSGGTAGQYSVRLAKRDGSETQSRVVLNYRSGIRVPAGDTLVATAGEDWEHSCISGYGVSYALSGYYAQP